MKVSWKGTKKLPKAINSLSYAVRKRAMDLNMNRFTWYYNSASQHCNQPEYLAGWMLYGI